MADGGQHVVVEIALDGGAVRQGDLAGLKIKRFLGEDGRFQRWHVAVNVGYYCNFHNRGTCWNHIWQLPFTGSGLV